MWICIYLNFVLILYTLHFVLLIHTFFVLSLCPLSLSSVSVVSSFSLMGLWSSPHRLARPFPYSNIVVETFPSVCGYLLLSVSLLSITLLFICDIIVFVDTGIFTFTSNFGFCSQKVLFLLYRTFLFFFCVLWICPFFFVSYSFIPF